MLSIVTAQLQEKERQMGQREPACFSPDSLASPQSLLRRDSKSMKGELHGQPGFKERTVERSEQLSLPPSSLISVCRHSEDSPVMDVGIQHCYRHFRPVNCVSTRDIIGLLFLISVCAVTLTATPIQLGRRHSDTVVLLGSQSLTPSLSVFVSFVES